MSTQEASPSLKVWSLQLLQSKLVLRRCHEILASSPPQNETEVLRCVHGRLQARISQLREDLNATSAESVVRNRLSHVAQIRALSVNVIVLNCSLVQLFHLERGAEQALIWSRLQQYVEPRTGASDALSTFAHDFDAANDAVEALVRDRGEAVDAPDARQWTALTAERIELLLPVRRLGASFDASDRHCSICLALYKPREDVRTFHPCDHVFHAGCLDNWLLNGNIFWAQHGHRCPLCRQVLKGGVDSPAEDSLRPEGAATFGGRGEE